MRFLRDTKAIRSLRVELRNAVKEGRTLDGAWIQSTISEAGAANLRREANHVIRSSDEFEWVYCLQQIGQERRSARSGRQ